METDLQDVVGKPSGLSVREVSAGDIAQVTNFFLRLSQDDRYLRFQFPITDEMIRKYTEKLRPEQVFLVGVFKDGVLMALGELHFRDTSGAVEAELAIAIDPQIRGSGWGNRLAEFIKFRALAIGVNSLEASYLPMNRPMQRIARHLGMFEKREFRDQQITARTVLA